MKQASPLPNMFCPDPPGAVRNDMNRPLPGTHAFEVPPELSGERLDRALVALLGPGSAISRSRLQAWIKAGRVRVAGVQAARPNLQVDGGVEILLDIPGEEPAVDVEGHRIVELEVLHEDEAIVVVDKPAGLLVHPTDRLQTGTLVHLAKERFGELPEVQGADRPGVVHRLDRLTSGVMVLGRTLEALEHLKRQKEAERFAKKQATRQALIDRQIHELMKIRDQEEEMLNK